MKNSAFTALSYPHYRWFSLGMFVSFIGSQMQVVGVSWHVYQITKSAYSLGLIGIAGFLPLLFFSAFGGVVVDAFDRKKLLLFNQIVLGLVNSLFAYISFFHYESAWIMYGVISI